MKVRVYHFDMLDRELVGDLCFNPKADAAVRAWNAGKYDHVYDVDIYDQADNDVALETAFAETQDTGTGRSTSVGDIMVTGEGDQRQAYLIDTVGFKAITI